LMSEFSDEQCDKGDGSDVVNQSELLTEGCSAESINPRASAIKEDLAFIRECITPAAVITVSKEYVTLVIIRTQYSRVQFHVGYTEAYPFELPTLELSSPTLPIPLLQNKQKECLENARPLLGQSMMKALYEPIHKFIHTNMFIPCWKEMKQISTLCENKGKIGADEKEGVVLLKLNCCKYKHTVKLKVPYNYPEDGVKVEFSNSNFPEDIQYMFQSQVDEIVRRCAAGATVEQAMQVSNPIKFAEIASKSVTPTPRLTTNNLLSLKHDVGVLKQISDLRVATTSGSKAKYVTQVNAERREARRDLRKLAREESAADQEAQKAILEEEQNEMKDLIKGKASETAQPSLYAAAHFLVEDFACRLPLELCQACKKPVLPELPESEKPPDSAPSTSKTRAARANLKPMRTFCGHWLHFQCLNEWLTTPPFVRMCPVCARRIWHPDWPEDHKQLEKAWQANEARKREMCDVSDFMGMGEKFSAK